MRADNHSSLVFRLDHLLEVRELGIIVQNEAVQQRHHLVYKLDALQSEVKFLNDLQLLWC